MTISKNPCPRYSDGTWRASAGIGGSRDIKSVGTDAECQTYLNNVRKAPSDQITAKVLEAVRAEIRHSYGHPGFIPGK